MSIRLATEANDETSKVIAKLYECRDLAKILLGERYQDTMQDYGKKILEIASKTGQSELRVAQDWAQGYFDETHNPHPVAIIMAAAVELIEPSQEDSNV